jgi:adenosylcobinamide-GDP ribazoletransferase
LLGYFALCGQGFGRGGVLLLGLVHVMSRSLSAVSGTLLPVRPGEGTLNVFHQAADKTVGYMAIGWVVLCAAAMVAVWPLAGGVMALGAVVTLLLVRRMAMKQFEGMSGDIAGFQLQATELVMLALLVLTERISAAV